MDVRNLVITAFVFGTGGCDGVITVRGHVFDSRGAPIEGVPVTLFPESSREGWNAVPMMTNARGCFVIRDIVAPGRNPYLVVIESSEYHPAQARVFSGEMVNEVEMHLVPIEVKGESTSKSRERRLTERTYFDVDCGSDENEKTPTSDMSLGRIERLDPRFDSLIPRDATLESVAEGIEWAEGPLWDAEDDSLLFSDVPRNGVFRWKRGKGVTQFVRASGYTGAAPFTGREPGSNGLAFDGAGRLVMCQHGDRSIVRREHDGRITVLVDRYQGKRLNSPNDLVLKSNGDLYFTDPPFGLAQAFDDPSKELDFQGVFRLSADGALMALVTNLDAPNGIGFSPDEKTLYVSNALNQRPVWMAYPVLADGTLGQGRQFAEASAWVKEGEGVPDGLKIDRNGNVFAAAPGGIHVFAPDGSRLGRIVTGVPTGNLAWGEDGGVLYIAANHRILRLPTATRGIIHRANH